MKLYNTLTREIEEFTTRVPNVVSMYTCGPTVYHFAHIGNLRTYIMEDILEKYFKYRGYRVNRVMNITDIGHLSSDADTGEDKMLLGAKREKKTVLEVAKYYTDAFLQDCAKLNIVIPEKFIPATVEVEEFIQVISVLEKKGFAYKAGGNVYFDTSKLKEYHKFFKFKEDDLEEGVRDGVEKDKNKRNKNDFVLWFTQSKFDDQALKWDSPWGIGYPGWHIECSCISMKYLGEYVDIKCGGVDNIFPHHTNEIAQSEAFLGHEWCKHWFHTLHLNIVGGKMSKSLGNFLTLSSLEENGHTAMEYRFFCLQSHYRKALQFSEESFTNAANAYQKLKEKTLALQKSGAVDRGIFDKFTTKFIAAMDNDLNTALAITTIYDILKENTNASTKIALLKSFDSVLSLNLFVQEEWIQKEKKDIALTEREILTKIEERARAKKEKDFAKADAIRDALAQEGIVLIDTPSGTTYTIK